MDERRKRRRRSGRLGLALAGLVVLLWVAARVFSDGTPRYRGETANHYFPKWTRQDGQGLAERWPRDAGADAVPFLVDFLAGIRDEASREGWASTHWDRLPEALTDRLPYPLSAGSRSALAAESLAQVLGNDPGAWRTVTNRFGGFPDMARAALVARLPRPSGEAGVLRRELLRQALADPDIQIRLSAAYLALQSEEDLGVLLRESLPVLEAGEAARHARGWMARLLLPRLGAYGPLAAEAVPLLRRWENSTDPELRLAATMALARIEQGPEAMLALLEGPIASRGWAEVRRFFSALHSLSHQPPTALPPAVTQPFWRRLASERGAQELAGKIRATQAGEGEPEEADRAARLRVDALQVLAVHRDNDPATSAVVMEGLRSSDPRVVAAALRALEARGPVAPETLPELVALLPNGALRGTLVPSLARYGTLASNAIPALERLATGLYPEDWTDRRELFGNALPGGIDLDSEQVRLMMQRYGLSVPRRAVDTPREPGKEVPAWLEEKAQQALKRIRGESSAPDSRPGP